VTELGMLSHPGFRICFVLDKTSMFSIISEQRVGGSGGTVADEASMVKEVKHSVKPLQLLWTKFPQWWSERWAALLSTWYFSYLPLFLSRSIYVSLMHSCSMWDVFVGTHFTSMICTEISRSTRRMGSTAPPTTG
jgi:hypothetical protein